MLYIVLCGTAAAMSTDAAIPHSCCCCCCCCCRAVFAAADENGDGCLDLQELAAVLGQLGQPLSLEDVQAIME
jgi:hypothetical protein